MRYFIANTSLELLFEVHFHVSLWHRDSKLFHSVHYQEFMLVYCNVSLYCYTPLLTTTGTRVLLCDSLDSFRESVSDLTSV